MTNQSIFPLTPPFFFVYLCIYIYSKLPQDFFKGLQIKKWFVQIIYHDPMIKNLLEHHWILTPRGRAYLIQYILKRERFNLFEFNDSSSRLPNCLRKIVLEAQKNFEHSAIRGPYLISYGFCSRVTWNVFFCKNFEKLAKMGKIPRTQVAIMRYPKKKLCITKDYKWCQKPS